MSQLTRPGSRHPGPTPTWTDRLRTYTVLTAGGRRTGPRSALGPRLGLRASGQVSEYQPTTITPPDAACGIWVAVFTACSASALQ
jgi:hypothetical protein